MSFTFAPRLPGDFALPGALPDGVTTSVQYKSASNVGTIYGNGTPWAISQVPWGGSYGLYYESNILPIRFAQAVQNQLASLGQRLATAQAAVATAQTQVDAKQAALDTAKTALKEASTATDQAQGAVTQAQTTFQTFERRVAAGTAAQGDLDAALTAFLAAQAAFALQFADYETKYQAYQTAQSDLANATTTLGNDKQTADELSAQITFANLNLPLAVAADAAYAAMAGTPNDGFNYVTGYPVESISGPGDASSGGATNSLAEMFRTQDIYGNPSSLYYFFIYSSSGAYRQQVNLTDDAYQLLLASGLRLQVSWVEVTTATPMESVTIDVPAPGSDYVLFETGHSLEPTVSYRQQTETLDFQDAVQLPDGSWQLTTTGDYSSEAPADLGTPGSGTISPPAGTCGTPPGNVMGFGVRTAPSLPSVASGAIEVQGADRQRQGWSEFFTPPGQASAVRYLTITASKAPNAPAGANYSGSVSWVPAPVPPALRSYPLVLQADLSADCTPTGFEDPANYFNNALAVPSEYGQVKDAVTLLLNDPPGLILTLSNPQPAGAILAQAQAVRDAAWPVDKDAGDGPPTDPDPTPTPTPPLPPVPAPEQTDFYGAINFTSADGDHVVAQKMRFQLVFNANDTRVQRATSFEATFHWAYKRRNLLTGVVTMEPYSRTISFPDVVTTTDPVSKQAQTAYNYFVADTDWTEVTAGENESVELVLLPGENAQPHTFTDTGPVLKLVTDDSDDADSRSR